MKKRSLAIIMAALLSLSLASCGGKVADNADNGATPDAAATESVYETDKDGVVVGTKQDGAVEEVNMDKVKGEKLKETTPYDETLKSSGELGGLKTSIDDAKLIDTVDGKAVVVSFTFKNDTSQPVSFNGMFDVLVTENNAKFSPLAAVGVEGINVNAASELIESGKTATVQKTYAYSGEKKMNVTVQIYGQKTGEMIGKAFEF